MTEFSLPTTTRDRSWLDLRARLARAARDMHFSAVSGEAINSALLLAIAGSLAGLAISIPISPQPKLSGGPVDASTLLATQILQLDRTSRHELDD
jgi:hypothetical protein